MSSMPVEPSGCGLPKDVETGGDTIADGEPPDVELPVDQVLATAAGEHDKNAAEDSTTEGGDTSPVAEEAMIAHARDNENATEVLAAKEDRDASDEPSATSLVRSNYNDDLIMGVA
ncbi:hypothetical protein MTO96_012082 [Rhipicephalus appendiculatus]